MIPYEKKIRQLLKKWGKENWVRTSCLYGETRVDLFLAYLFHEITHMDKQAWSAVELADFYDHARSLAQEALNY